MAARIPDIQTLINAGIDPKTGLPLKMGAGAPAHLKNDVKKLLRIIDEQDAVNRFKWYNLPDDLDGNLLERIIYYKGQAMFFKLNEKFYFLPYALDGTIDPYGRYTGCTPLPFNGSTSDEKQKVLIPGLVRTPKYTIADEVPDKPDDLCVLLHDYTKQISQTTISRQILNEPLLDVMADCIPFMRTSLIANTGIMGMRVAGADQERNVTEASESIENAALTGEVYVPIISSIEFQELLNKSGAKPEEYMLAMQSLDNFRLSTYGLENGGLFEKKAHLLESENAVNQANVGLVFQDSLNLRQKFCDIVNSIWGLGIWCEPSEAVMGTDTNGDGVAYDIQDTTEETEGVETDDVQ